MIERRIMNNGDTPISKKQSARPQGVQTLQPGYGHVIEISVGLTGLSCANLSFSLKQ